jgi:hypothetical protein
MTLGLAGQHYGGTELHATEFNADPNNDGSTADSTVASVHRIEVRVGGGPAGASNNPQDVKQIGPVASEPTEWNSTSHPPSTP